MHNKHKKVYTVQVFTIQVLQYLQRSKQSVNAKIVCVYIRLDGLGAYVKKRYVKQYTKNNM